MAPLKDPRLVAAIKNALEEGLRFSGYVTWNPRSQQAVRTELPGYTTKAEIDRRTMYIETVLLSDDPNDPALHVVNLHPA